MGHSGLSNFWQRKDQQSGLCWHSPLDWLGCRGLCFGTGFLDGAQVLAEWTRVKSGDLFLRENIEGVLSCQTLLLQLSQRLQCEVNAVYESLQWQPHLNRRQR